MGGAPGGAKGPQAQGFPPKQAPSVVLHVVENADLAGSSEYLGRVESIQTVLLKPQVPAEIAQVHFKEGAIVKAGQLLFSLDNKQYAATVALRRAERHYQQELASLTGSRVGTSGNVTIWTRSTERLGLSTFKQEMQRKADLAFGRLPKGSVIVEPLVPVGTEKSQ